MYFAWLTFGDAFKDVYFPDQESWISTIMLGQNETGWESDVYVAARALEGRVYLRPRAPLTWSDGTHREREVKGDALLSMRNSANGREFKAIIKRCKREYLAFEKYRIPQRAVIIGRGERVDIRDDSPLMSAEHGALGMSQDGTVKYRDNSNNGTYVNGRKLLRNTARLSIGDVLAFPTGLKVVYLGNCIAVNRTLGVKNRFNLEPWRPAPEKRPPEADDREAPSVYLEYQRAPRMLVKCEAEDTEIEAPIPKQNQQQLPLFLQLGPSMTMILPMLMGSVVASGGSNLLSSGVVMISTSSALAVMWGLINRSYRKKQERVTESTRLERYRQYIEEMEAELRGMNQKELERLEETFPNAAQCAQMPEQRSDSLWNRMPTHPDFLCVRVGTGDVDLPCEITVPKQKLSIIDDPLRQEPDRLKATYSVMIDAPVTLPLRNEAVIGVLGGMRAVLFTQGLLMQIAALHSYHDVHIAVLTEEGSASQWQWTRWLPHVFTSEDRELRMVAYTPDDIHDVVAHLDEVLSIRKSNAAENADADNEEGDKDAPPLPHYVNFCTNYRILEDEPIMRQLLTNRAGMTLVMLGTAMTQLPKECHIVLNMQGGDGYLHSSEGDTRKIDFEYPDRGLIKSFSRRMAPMRVRDVAQNAAIPTLVSFLDIYGVRRVEQLEVWRMWKENHTYDGLKSVIGYRAGSQPFVLDISDKYHGPHGLIAGTTGSGKSVMLETYIRSLALNYSPRQVQFILIDYKGGGMADAFRALPHVAGIIDNLQGARVIDRALASLNGEIHRRERIFKAVGINNINDYTRKFGEEEGMELPHLIIIVDEFAELKSEQSEFMAELVSASRVGRSLGIHLILATQKPSNSVSDEIWANSRFHLCLRVQTRQDSMEMLKRPDAAYIKGMGRCFIQIGNDELFEQVQTSYSGLDYRPDEPRPEEMPQLLDPTGHVVRAPKKREEEKAEILKVRGELSGKNAQDAKGTETQPEAHKSAEKRTQMTAVLERIYEVAGEHGMAQTKPMWLPELPAHIYLRDLDFFRCAASAGEGWPDPAGNIRIPLGLADDVAHQRYLPFWADLTEMRNIIAVGLAGSGKTTLVQSMVYSLCQIYDPAHVHLYILSLTSQTLGTLAAFPQVGDVVFDGEDMEQKRFVNMLFAEMERRAELFAAASTDSFIEYNRARRKAGEAPQPAIIVFIDRFKQFWDLFANDEAYANRIQKLVQEGSGRGIHFVVTAMAKNEVPSRWHSFFGGIALQLKEKSDYSECIGKRVPYDMPPIATVVGRGMGVLQGGIFEVQLAMGGAAPERWEGQSAPMEDVERFAIDTALPAQEEPVTDVERAQQIGACARAFDARWSGARPAAIPRIPQEPTWEMLFKAHGFAQTRKAPFEIPVGYDMEAGCVATINIEEAPSWAVYGPRRCGVTNFLKQTARVMKDRGADVCVFGDVAWNALASALEIQLCTTPEQIADYLQSFIVNCARPRKPLRDAAMEKGKAALRRQAAEFRQVCLLIDNAERLYDMFNVEAYRKHLPVVQGLLGEIAEKPYYNILMMMGISQPKAAVVMQEPLRKLVSQGRAIALGGKLNEFDPCNVGQPLPSRLRGAALPKGQAFVGDNGAVSQIVVSLAETEQ